MSEYSYEDIIHLPHHVSARHPQMSLMARAAQFSPFAALTGHDAAIREKARLTEAFVELEDDQKEQLDRQLQILKENQFLKPEIEITYFQPDSQKSGGAYVTFQGRMKRIDAYKRQILFTDGTALSIDRILSIRSGLC